MTYQHIKTEGLYDVLGTLRIQTDRPLRDLEELVLYRSRKDASMWGRPPEEFFDPSRFRMIHPSIRIGDQVRKVEGYGYPGELRSMFWTRAGKRRFVVEATGHGYAGRLHIFNAAQLGFEDIGY